MTSSTILYHHAHLFQVVTFYYPVVCVALVLLNYFVGWLVGFSGRRDWAFLGGRGRRLCLMPLSFFLLLTYTTHRPSSHCRLIPIMLLFLSLSPASWEGQAPRQ